MRTFLGFLTLSLLAGCHSRPRFAGDDLKKLSQSMKSLQDPKIAPDDLQLLLIDALGELDLHRSDGCKKLLVDFVHDDNAAERATAGAKLPGECGFTCRFSDATAQLPAVQQTRAILEICPKPDPLEAVPMHEQMSPGDYLVIRGLVDQAESAIAADGSADAQAARKNLEALLPKVVAANAKEFQAFVIKNN